MDTIKPQSDETQVITNNFPDKSGQRSLMKRCILGAMTITTILSLQQSQTNAEGPLITQKDGAIEWTMAGGNGEPTEYLKWAKAVGKTSEQQQIGLQALNWLSWRSEGDQLTEHKEFSPVRTGIFKGPDAEHLVMQIDGQKQLFDKKTTALLESAVFTNQFMSLDNAIKLNILLTERGVNVVFVPYGLTKSEMEKAISGNTTIEEENLFIAKIREAYVRARGNNTNKQLIPLHQGFAIARHGRFVGRSAIVIQNFRNYSEIFDQKTNELLWKALYSDDKLTIEEFLLLNKKLEEQGLELMYIPDGMSKNQAGLLIGISGNE